MVPAWLGIEGDEQVNEIKTLNIAAIVLDPGLQPRVHMVDGLAEAYARDMENGDEFNPITVYWNGVNYLLTSGWHRLEAHKLLGRASIKAEVVQGTFDDALWFSVGANNKNGARLSVADRRRNIEVLLRHPLLSKKPVSEIARQCDASATLVKKVRDEMGIEAPDTIKMTTKTGKVVERKAKTENKKTKEQPKAEEPDEFEMLMEDAQTERIQQLEQENKNLSDRLAVAALDATDEEKKLAEQTIADLREEVRQLEIRLEAVTKSRDTFQGENAQMKRQIAMLQKQLKGK